MRGHVAKKGRRYYVVIYEGVNASTGKPKRRWHTAGETRAEAEKLLAELVKRAHDGDYRAPDKITVGDYLLHRWLPAKKTRLKPTTAGVYKTQGAGVGSCQPVPESAADVGFRDSAVSASACGCRPVSNCTLEDPLEA